MQFGRPTSQVARLLAFGGKSKIGQHPRLGAGGRGLAPIKRSQPKGTCSHLLPRIARARWGVRASRSLIRSTVTALPSPTRRAAVPGVVSVTVRVTVAWRWRVTVAWRWRVTVAWRWRVILRLGGNDEYAKRHGANAANGEEYSRCTHCVALSFFSSGRYYLSLSRHRQCRAANRGPPKQRPTVSLCTTLTGNSSPMSIMRTNWAGVAHQKTRRGGSRRRNNILLNGFVVRTFANSVGVHFRVSGDSTDAWATFRENAPQIVAGVIVVVFSIWVLLRRRWHPAASRRPGLSRNNRPCTYSPLSYSTRITQAPGPVEGISII